MRFRHSISYTAMLALFVAAPILAVESISQTQSLEGQVWVQRGNDEFEASISLENQSGDLISTSDSGRLETRLWSDVNLRLDPSSKVLIISNADKKNKAATVVYKMIKLEYGASCIEVDQLMQSEVLFQVADRVTIKLNKPVEICLSTDFDKSHIRLIKGRVELMQLSNSMLIALNEPGSEINFFNGGIFSLVSPTSASPQVMPTQDPKDFLNTKNLARKEDLKKSSEAVDSKAASLPEAPAKPGEKEAPTAPSKSVELEAPSISTAPIGLPKSESSKEPSKTTGEIAQAKTEEPAVLSKTEAVKEPLPTEKQETPAETFVPIALAEPEDSKEQATTVDQKALAKTPVPIALTEPKGVGKSAQTVDSQELYNVYLHQSRSYESTAEVNRRLRDSGYDSTVIDEIDDKGPLFRISVPDFETALAAREFVDKVVVSLGIHDAWIERHPRKGSKAVASKKPVKTMDQKELLQAAAPIALTKTKIPQKPSNTQGKKAAVKTDTPIAVSEVVDSNTPPKSENAKALYNVYLHQSRSYEATAEVNRRLRDSGYSSTVIDEIDNNGPIFRIGIANFETATAAREFVDKVVGSLGIQDAWIERHLKELPESEVRKAALKTTEQKVAPNSQASIALSKTQDTKAPPKSVDQKLPAKSDAPIALANAEDLNEPAKSGNSKELYNVNLHASRSYESTAEINRRLRDSGYRSVVIDEIDNKGPLFRVSVPNFETVTAARGFVDKVVVSLGIHDAWIERQRSIK